MISVVAREQRKRNFQFKDFKNYLFIIPRILSKKQIKRRKKDIIGKKTIDLMNYHVKEEEFSPVFIVDEFLYGDFAKLIFTKTKQFTKDFTIDTKRLLEILVQFQMKIL